ncbi:Ubiquitin carboxyl-terminal hydrolase [Aphelenchoides fujianensis]|nr:Ubiquitin carboxyl-terminal hydrolase [Aphelenchoides fujianensis]
MAYYDKSSKSRGKCMTVDARETAPAATNFETFKEKPEEAASERPGEVHGYWTVYKRHASGNVAWQDLLMPTTNLEHKEKEIMAEPTMKKFFVNPQRGSCTKRARSCAIPKAEEIATNMTTREFVDEIVAKIKDQTLDQKAYGPETAQTMGIEWIPLESNPDAFNAFINKLGIKGAHCVDVYGFDDELIELVPKPHLALILCYPNYKKVDEIMKPVYDKLAADGAKIPDDVFFMKQKISNACGTFALFHALTQNVDKLKLGDGPFAKWYEEAKTLGVDERSDSLARSNTLSEAHEAVANSGETDANPEGGVEHHFIAYVNMNGTLFEFDSRMTFPRACGPTSQDTLIKDAGVHCKELAAKLENVSFCAIALQLKIHNDLRAKHGAAPLVLDEELNALAMDWAKKLAKTGEMVHRPNNWAGENLYWSTGSPNEATQMWYDEINLIGGRDLEVAAKDSTKEIKHFTQVVWKGTQKVGIAVVHAEDGKHWVVANYFPKGNWIGEFKANSSPTE